MCVWKVHFLLIPTVMFIHILIQPPSGHNQHLFHLAYIHPFQDRPVCPTVGWLKLVRQGPVLFPYNFFLSFFLWISSRLAWKRFLTPFLSSAFAAFLPFRPSRSSETTTTSKYSYWPNGVARLNSNVVFFSACRNVARLIDAKIGYSIPLDVTRHKGSP